MATAWCMNEPKFDSGDEVREGPEMSLSNVMMALIAHAGVDVLFTLRGVTK